MLQYQHCKVVDYKVSLILFASMPVAIFYIYIIRVEAKPLQMCTMAWINERQKTGPCMCAKANLLLRWKSISLPYTKKSYSTDIVARREIYFRYYIMNIFPFSCLQSCWNYDYFLLIFLRLRIIRSLTSSCSSSFEIQ